MTEVHPYECHDDNEQDDAPDDEQEAGSLSRRLRAIHDLKTHTS
jgi:hypothetical protein